MYTYTDNCVLKNEVLKTVFVFEDLFFFFHDLVLGYGLDLDKSFGTCSCTAARCHKYNVDFTLCNKTAIDP